MVDDPQMPEPASDDEDEMPLAPPDEDLTLASGEPERGAIGLAD